MIRGRYVLGRPQVGGLLQFLTVTKYSRRLIPVRFVVDSGADATLVLPTDYEPEGPPYSALRKFPLAESRGYGGSIEARSVPVALYLRHENGRYDRIGLKAEFAKPDEAADGLPSVLGRDVIDLYRLTLDRSVGLVVLDAAHGNTDPWPDQQALSAP